MSAIMHPLTIETVAQGLRTVSTSIEARFLDVGSHLADAIATIEALTATFDRLNDALRGDTLRQATQCLADVITDIAAMAHRPAGTGPALQRLQGLVGDIQGHVGTIARSVHGISILAVNARIEAVTITVAGDDFIGFTADISRTIDVAKDRLTDFSHELEQMRRRLDAAHASQQMLAQRQAAAVQSIPQRLSLGIETLTERSINATAAASSVARKSRDVSQRIGQAVAALQIGDSTRQRLEHIEDALTVATRIMAGDWAHAAPADRTALHDLACRLQAAQLDDTASQFTVEMGHILGSFHDLAADTQEIRRLGLTVASAGRGDTFLAAVEDQMAEVQALIGELGTASRAADDVAASVTAAAQRLTSHTATLRSLEEDIRLMGLNTTLKCARIGAAGRPLMVIAQELRLFARQIATESECVTACLEQVMGVACDGEMQHHGASRVGAIADNMTRSTEQLQSAGHDLADGLVALERDSDHVGYLLRAATDTAGAHEAMGQGLLQAAAALAGSGDAEAPSAAAGMLDGFADAYTMDRERLVHNRFAAACGGLPQLVMTQPDGAAAALDDCLF
jgi:hypothetical protein